MKKYKDFNTLPWSKTTFLNDFTQLENLDLVWNIFRNGDICLSKWNEENQHIITVNDTFNTSGLSDIEIIEMIKNKINIDIETKQWIIELNSLFKSATEFLNNVLYKNVWNDIRNNVQEYFNCDDIDTFWTDVIKFLRETEKWKRISQTHCRIAKLIYWVHNILDNSEIYESEINAKKIIESSISPGIQVSNYEELMKNWQSKCCIVLNKEIINFELVYRWKTDFSSLLKMIYHPDYNNSDLIMDPIWIELVCEKEEELALLLNHFYTTSFSEKISWMKHKNFDISNIKNIDWLTWDFINELNNSDWNTKSSTNPDYQDMKILWRINWLLVEFRWIVLWNKQNDILKSNEIYYLWKILSAMARLDWYITENYIKLVINRFFNKFPDFQWKITNTSLLNYLKKPLIEIDRWRNTKIYTTTKRYDTLYWTEFYPENFNELI